jgi:flagellar motor switch protein FliG
MASDRDGGGIRQAAILLASVDSQTARQLLQQMPTATAKAVRKAMVDLGRVDPEEQRAVLAAFHARVQKQKSPASSQSITGNNTPGVNTPRRDESSPLSPPHAPFGSTAQFSPGTPFQNGNSSFVPAGSSAGMPDYWDQYSAEQIIEVVQSERPTVIAVVLTQLRPIAANQVLSRLPAELRKDVLVQLSKLQQIEFEIIEEIKEQLAQKLALTRPIAHTNHDMGISRLKSILEAGDEQAKLELCQAIRDSGEVNGPFKYWINEQIGEAQQASIEKDRQARRREASVTSPASSTGTNTASAAGPPAATETSNAKSNAQTSVNAKSSSNAVPGDGARADGMVFDTAHSYVDFDDLKWIGLNQLAMILQTCDPRALLVALSTADEELLARVAMLFSNKDWKRLKDRLQNLGKVDDEDRLAARMIVAETAQQLLIGEDLSSISSTAETNFAKAA